MTEGYGDWARGDGGGNVAFGLAVGGGGARGAVTVSRRGCFQTGAVRLKLGPHETDFAPEQAEPEGLAGDLDAIRAQVTKMRTLAIGDIHGCNTALETLLEAAAITPEDFVIFLGDYIDRGPNSKAVVSRVIRLIEHGRGVALRGNHEVMILSARTTVTDFRMWRLCGGDRTLDSYQKGCPGDWRTWVPETHWRFFEEGRAWFETPSHIFVHGSVAPGLDLGDQPDFALFWEQFDPQLRHKSGKTVVCGHTIQDSGWPARGAHAVCIDTGAYAGEWLTCLDMDSGRFWQANELAAARSGELRRPDGAKYGPDDPAPAAFEL